MREKLILLIVFCEVGIGVAGSAQGRGVRPAAPAERGSGARFMLVHADVPLYPLVARMARLDGTVHIRVRLRKGLVIETKTKSEASPVLVKAATKNVRTWRFSSSATGAFDVTYVYALEKEEEIPPVNPNVEMRLPYFVKVTGVPAKPRTAY